ncbi:hypothetical protein ABIB68_006611 [Bradyrhizobium sp. F1.2.2]
MFSKGADKAKRHYPVEDPGPPFPIRQAAACRIVVTGERVSRALPTVKLIAAGGIRDGVDLAKAIRLAADIAGQAAGVLRGDGVHRGGCRAFRDRHRPLGCRCFCTASADPAALRQARLLPLAHLPAG